MPGYDGTGPQGMGSMTGGARGMCSPAAEGYAAGRGMGRGMGSGRGVLGGFGPGRGMRRGFRAGSAPSAYPLIFGWTETTELDMLMSRAAAVQNTLDAINRRIVELDKTSK